MKKLILLATIAFALVGGTAVLMKRLARLPAESL